MPHIDYFCAPVSPNVYLAGTRLEAVAARHGATITYKPVDIPGLFARTGGAMVGARHQNRQEYRLQELRRNAALAGLPINLHPAHFPTNAAPASYAVIAAQSAAGGDLGGLIPTVIDQNPCAHLRMPRDMIFHGWSMRLFQAWQHSATMSS